MTKLFVAAIALLLSIGLAQAQTVRKVEIYEYGTYSSSPDIELGVTRQGMPYGGLDYIDLVDMTDTVIAQLGVKFGFRYRLVGPPEGTAVPLKMVMRYPSPGIMAEGAKRPFTDDDYTVVQYVGDDLFRTWTFTERTDLVPGIWTFEIWHGKKKLAEKKFKVILPPIAGLTSELKPGA